MLRCTRFVAAFAIALPVATSVGLERDACADVAGINLGAPVWDGVAAEEALQASIATGAHYVRVNFRLDQWSAPGDATLHGGKTWFQVYDHVVDAITSHGLEVYGLLNDEVTHGFSRADLSGSAFEDAYAESSLAIVDRYKDRVRVWETINEPNDYAGATSARVPPDAFARLHARLYDEIKRAHAGDACWDVRVVTGPLFSFDDASSADYLDRTIAAGRAGGRWKAVRDALGHDPIDGIGYHLYVAQGSGSPASDVGAKGGANLDAIDAVLAKYGITGAQEWVSEIGWRVPDVDEAMQAARVDEMFAAFGAREGVASLMWFSIQDFPGNDWGLYRSTGFGDADARPSRGKLLAQVTVHAPALAARLEVTLPASVVAGSKVLAKLKATNLGTEAWTRDALVRLGAAAGCPSAAATNGWTWDDPGASSGYVKSAADARVFLAAGASVAQGESASFDVALTAPKSPGSARFAARMVREGLAWFGATARADVTVTAEATPDAGADASDADAKVSEDGGAGSNDGGATADAPGEGDASVAADGGSADATSGCGCSDAGARDDAGVLPLGIVLGIAALLRRRAAGASNA